MYSKFDKDGNILQKLVKCNNCESLYNVYDICKADLKPGKDQTEITVSFEDMQLMMPEKLCAILLKYRCDKADWEHALDIIEEERWGEHIIIKRDIIDEEQHVKILFINKNNMYKIDNKIIKSKISIS